MSKKDEFRIRNPFREPLVTEFIEDPHLYQEMFSEKILIGETLEVFQPTNVVLLGPQGSGKSMILNLMRYKVLSEWISRYGKPPAPLGHVAPFFGISINLARASFHAFGRRSVNRLMPEEKKDPMLDASCAADFLNHYLFREFIKGIEFLSSREGKNLKKWLKIDNMDIKSEKLVKDLSLWPPWFGYYSGCSSIQNLLDKCEDRLNTWRSFLNANIDEIPSDIWKSKSSLGEPLHYMGNFLCNVSKPKILPLFVIIDQYEVLPELNPQYGPILQRLVNTLIKARDPVVFYKIGARTYDWGKELRIWGTESRIEVLRDYVTIDLTKSLMRSEDSRGWLFPAFAKDVAYKRMKGRGRFKVDKDKIEKMLGKWDEDDESDLYFKKDKSRRLTVLTNGSKKLKHRIESLCGIKASTLELRLADAWVLEKQQKKTLNLKIHEEMEKCPWRSNASWRKERVGIALLQIASKANQKKYYYGWETVLYLSGGNITAFLILCSEIWDIATKTDVHPLKTCPLPTYVQTEGIYAASKKWRYRDINENPGGGRKRYEILSRLGPAIHDRVISDLAISNPGHSGFSLREMDLLGDKKGERVAEFLHQAVNWAIFEERPHTSKLSESATRCKWYLHPLLSPEFAIPHMRVKEPFYVNIDTVYSWLFETKKVKFGKTVVGTQKTLEESL